MVESSYVGSVLFLKPTLLLFMLSVFVRRGALVVVVFFVLLEGLIFFVYCVVFFYLFIFVLCLLHLIM
jgi:hypothetical protein